MSEYNHLVLEAINRVQKENAILREALDRIANDETDYPKQVAKEALQEKNNFPVEPKELHANGEATQDELDAAREAAAMDAARDAWYAAAEEAAARDAALEAARDVAKAKQEAELRRIL